METRFYQAARRHRIGRAAVRRAMATTTPTATTTEQGNPGWRCLGTDGRGRELEVIAVETDAEGDDGACLLVIHVLPTQLRKSK